MPCRSCRRRSGTAQAVRYRRLTNRAARAATQTPMQQPESAFQRVVCINLDRRPDRWRRFAEGLPADWPWPAPIRVQACDGQRLKPPDYWTSGRGAWGCYRSHLRIIEQALNDGIRSLLILEDDALFPPGFSAAACDWIRQVPADWQMLYLGGQHLRAGRHPPREIAPGLWQPYNVNRTHAFALQGDMLQIVYDHLLRRDWHARNHIDHHLGRLHQQRKHRIYCPPQWLVGQAEGRSNINGKTPPDRFWQRAQTVAASESGDDRRPSTSQALASPTCVVILGLHSSGSSALAQALWHCGLWFGESSDLTGYWGQHSPARGGEHRQLAALLEKAIPFRAVAHAKPRRWLWRQLRQFLAAHQVEARARGLLPAIKYPQLCQAGPQLQSLCGEGLRIILCDRNVQDSIDSLVRRTAASPELAGAVAAHQRWLAAGRDALVAQIPDQVYRLRYTDLLADPAAQLTSVLHWLDLHPTPAQLANATNAIKAPSTKH